MVKSPPPKSGVNSQCLFVWFQGEPLKDRQEKLRFDFSPYLISDVGSPSCGVGWAGSCQTPPTGCVGQIQSRWIVLIPDQLPTMSDLISMGIPAWWRTMCWEGLIDAQTSRCSREQCRLPFIWCAGVSTSPLQLLAYSRLLLLKEFGCMFGHMALHFCLFWQPNMIQQPISGLGLSSFKTTKTNKQSARLLPKWWLKMKATHVILRSFFFFFSPRPDFEKRFCVLVCFISLHYNIYSLHTLQRHAELQ